MTIIVLLLIAAMLLIRYEQSLIAQVKQTAAFKGPGVFNTLKSWILRFLAKFRPKKRIRITLDRENEAQTLSIKCEKCDDSLKRQNNPAISMQRAGYFKEIEAWVLELQKATNRKRKIQEWNFKRGESDILEVRFQGEDEYVCGKLSFVYDDGFPRVSRFTWEDKDGNRQYIGGRRIPQIPYEKLVNSFILSKQDAQKLQYINQVAYEAQQKGMAVFDICAYEQISEKTLKNSFGKREIKALASALTEFHVTRIDDKAGKFYVELPQEPEM